MAIVPTSEYNVNIIITTKDKTSAEASKAEKSLLSLANAAKVVALAHVAMRMAQKALEFVKLGAEADAAERRLIAFAGGVEQAEEYLKALNAGADNTIDRMTGMAQASRMLETDMVRNTYEMETAGAMVSKLGNQTWSTERRMQSLTMLLANQTILRLDDFGLSVESVRKRQKELEAQGLSTERAFRAAVFEEASAKLAVLGDTSDTAATQVAALEAAWKTHNQALGQSITLWLTATGILPTVTKELNLQAEYYDLLREAKISMLEVSGTEELAIKRAIVSSRTWQGDEENLRRALEETNAATREAERVTNAQAFATRLMTDSVADSLSTLGGLDQTMLDFVGTLTQGSTMASGFSKYVDDGSLSLREQTAAAAQASFAIMDLASSYASYMQQVAYSYTDYAGSMAEIEAQYQKTIEGITAGGGGAGGGAAAAAREFDRADIERGLKIKELQLKELEAERAGWEAEKETTEPVFWYELARADRKWLMDHGKTLEDLALKREETVDEVTELERAQMDDRVEDLKNEIAETARILKQGHWDQSQIRIGAAQRDTAALLAEAQTRRDAQIAALEKSQAREEEMNRQSLGRIKLAAFDHWLSMQEDTDKWTKAQWDAVEKMRLNIMTEYGLLTPALLAETIKWQQGFDSMFLAATTGAKAAVSEIQRVIDKLLEIPAEKRIKIITEIIKEERPGITVPEITRQHGGPVKAGMPYIVGEPNGELFVPQTSGYIIPHVETQRIINSNNQQTYNFPDARAMAYLGMQERVRARQGFAVASGM